MGDRTREGGLYGYALARAYAIESKISQYPRVVVGPCFFDYIRKGSQDAESDCYAEVNRRLADICLKMLAPDVDGHYMIHYLGEAYQACVSTTRHREIHDKALQCIHASLNKFWSMNQSTYVSLDEPCSVNTSENNTRLSLRYMQLLHYFGEYPPVVDGASPQ